MSEGSRVTGVLEESFGSRLLSKESEYERLTRENMDTLQASPALMEVVCRDACDGHDVCRVSLQSIQFQGYVRNQHVTGLKAPGTVQVVFCPVNM